MIRVHFAKPKVRVFLNAAKWEEEDHPRGEDGKFGEGGGKAEKVRPEGKVREKGLSEKQKKQVRSKEFKQWFGDWEGDPGKASKIVDAKGMPLVVYHGSPDFEGDRFLIDKRGGNTGAGSAQKAFFFGDIGTANTYAIPEKEDPASKAFDFLGPQDAKPLKENPSVTPVYLKAINPMVLDFSGEEYIGGKVNKAIEKAVKNGHDGIIIKNINDSMGLKKGHSGAVYAVFNPNQIKSATGNIGSFDPDTDSISNSYGKVRVYHARP